MPTLPDEFQMPEGKFAVVATDKWVVEALVMVPVVDQKFVAVRFVDEALLKREFPETVKLPPKYTLPVEFTERRLPGEVVPMPTLPSLLTKSKEEVAELIFRAAVLPVALETLTERTAEGEVEAMPTLPVVERKMVEVARSVLVPL